LRGSPGGGLTTFAAEWRLDDPDGKPEGLAFTAEGLAIVALDTQKARHNLVLSNLRSRPRRAQR